MKFTLSWLKEHLATEATLAEITETLTRIGLEVESVEDRAAALAPFKVAYVKSAARHPNADKLQVCRVETAGGEIEVVCGAPNARTGMKGIFAPVGAVIPATGDVLKAGAIRGVISNGMLCSARELKLGEDHDGIIEVPDHLPVGMSAAEALGVNDPVIEIAITPNRGDCNGVLGIARDLAAAGLGHVITAPVEPVPGRFASPVRTSLDFTPGEASACPLFAGRLVRGVKNGPSPDWLRRRLEAVGLRPISALVDITNLISLDRARPLHVFDAGTLKGNLRARMADAGETLTGLDGKDYRLTPDMIVIADDEAARGIAGVMGGLETGVTEATVDVFIEAALFDPVRIANAGRALGINSDARYRFERGVDPEGNAEGLELATRLILQLCGGEASEVVSAGAVPAWRRSISFDPARVKQLTGLDLKPAEILKRLGDLGCAVSGAGPFQVSPPSWRPDIHGSADLVEEVTRLVGLDQVPSVPLPRLHAVTRPGINPAQRRAREAGRALAARGYLQCVNYSFVPRAHAALFGGDNALVMLANPISADLDALRPSVLASLAAAAARNMARGASVLSLCETGPQFDSAEPERQTLVAAGLRAGTPARAWANAASAADVFSAKADALALFGALGGPVQSVQITADAPGWYHPGRSGALRLGTKPVAYFGELHPRLAQALDLKGAIAVFELFLDAIPLAKAKSKTRARLDAPDLPAVERDFAFLADEAVRAADLVKAVLGADKALIERASVFDVYRGPGVPDGKKSVAIAARLQPREKTLTEAEIDAVAAKIIAAVLKATGAALRG